MALTVAVPGAGPLKATEQLPADNVHVLALNDPPVVPADGMNVMEPVGVFAGIVVSVTVVVQLEGLPMLTVLGLQATLVAVGSTETNTLFAVASAFGSGLPFTVAPTKSVSGTTAAPLVISTQSLVEATLPLAQPALTQISMAAGAVESTLYVTVNSSPVVGGRVAPPSASMPRLATPLPSMPA